MGLAGLALFLSICNFSLDPFDIFAILKGQPASIHHDSATRTTKAYAARALAPDCLVLGTSRAAMGYQASSPAWKCSRPYNASLPQAHLYEMRRYLEHVIAQGQLRIVFLPLDFEQFRNTDRIVGDFSEARLAISEHGRHQLWPIDELLGFLIGAQSLHAGLEKLMGGPPVPFYEPDGDRSPQSLQRTPGAAEVSRKATLSLARLIHKPGAYPAGDPERLEAFVELEKIIDLCSTHGLELFVVVNPVHAYYHEMLQQLNLRETFLRWKTDVARLMSGRLPRQKYWDFDRPNMYSIQPLPEDGDNETDLTGFWDPSHFRFLLGDAVMQLAMNPSGEGHSEILGKFSLPVAGTSEASLWEHTDPRAADRVKNWLAPIYAIPARSRK